MSRRTTSISRQATAELRFLLYSRRLLVVALVLMAGVAIAFSGSLSQARSAHENFVREVATYESHGITLEDALAAPVTVRTTSSGETIDNPLKYDYLEVGRSLAALQGLGMVGTALDLVTFIVIPLTFLVLGAGMATVDRSTGTASWRGIRERWPRVAAAKLLVLGIVGLGAAVLTALLGLVASVVGSSAVAGVRDGIDYALAPATPSPVLPKIAMTALVGLLFGVLGYALGAVTRSASWPMVLAGVALFVLPFVSAWDLRNLLAVLGSGVYDFWGQFEMRPPIEVGTLAAVVAVGCYLAAAGVVTALVSRRPPLR